MAASRPLVVVLPGSRRGEAARHLPALLDAADRLYREHAVNLVLPASVTTGAGFFRERLGESPIRVIEGESWDAMAHADVALAASGTVTVEAALAGNSDGDVLQGDAAELDGREVPGGVPFYSMVNLIAGRAVVPELMQGQMTGEALAREAAAAARIPPRATGNDRPGLADVREKLAQSGGCRAPRRAAALIEEILEGQIAHAS